MAALAAAMILAVGCGPAATPPAPTAAPAKASEATKAPAAATAAAAQPKASFPEKGKSIMWTVPWGAGGGGDITARAFQPLLEKELGVSITVLNKAGGGGQTGLQEFLTTAKPDGYHIASTHLPNTPASYLDPERKATFALKDFQLVGNMVLDPVVFSVKKGSPYKTLKDLVDAAKANPGKIKLTSAGLMTNSHVAAIQLELAAGIKFAQMFYEQQGEQRAALLGGHADVEFNPVSETAGGVKDGDLIPLAIAAKEPSKYLPDVKTTASQGFPTVAMAAYRAISLPAGTPQDIVDKWVAALEKASKDPVSQAAFDKMNLAAKFMGPKELMTDWVEMEKIVQKIIDDTKKK